MRERAILFDFDFTLADSTAGAVECANHALGTMGLPPAEPTAIRATIGLGLPATFARLTGLDDPALARIFSFNFVQRAGLRMVELSSVFPDVAPTLDHLRRAGFRLGIVSTKFRVRIEAILARNGLGGAVDTIVGGEDVANGKPDPEGLMKALAGLGVRPQDGLYVGDHPVDAEAAAAARIPFVAVLTGASTRSDFDPWPAQAFLASLGELAPLVTRGMARRANPTGFFSTV